MSSVPTRRWEFLYRLLETGGAGVLQDPRVQERRVSAGVTDQPELHKYAWEEDIASGEEAKAAAEQAASAWCSLFDDWSDQGRDERGVSKFVFPDVYALGFFITVLEAGDTVFYRGQSNAAWGLQTSRTRAEAQADQLTRIDIQAQQFIKQLCDDAHLRSFYDGARPPSLHLEAACQHYGFPTHFLDFTTDFEVSAFFAEGGSDTKTPVGTKPSIEVGAVYAVPAACLPLRSTLLAILPPCFPRPRLQRGVFIEAYPVKVDLDSFEQAKYMFRHAHFPLRSSLGRLKWGDAPGMAEFYYPYTDPYAQAGAFLRSEPIVVQTRDRWYEQWVRETYALCFFDRGPGLQWANEHHLRLRCRSEPVLATNGFIEFVGRVCVHTEERDLKRESGMRFFLRIWASAMLHEDVLPPRMRSRVQSTVDDHHALLAI